MRSTPLATWIAALAAGLLVLACSRFSHETSAPPDMSFLDAFDYDDPQGSERRLEALAREAEAKGNRETLAQILTQIARCQGLQSRFAEGHATLARAESLAGQSASAQARIAIERGRLYRSAGEPERAKPFFIAAFEVAMAARDDYLALDAIHMIALVLPFSESLAWAERGYAFAAQSQHPGAVH